MATADSEATKTNGRSGTSALRGGSGVERPPQLVQNLLLGGFVAVGLQAQVGQTLVPQALKHGVQVMARHEIVLVRQFGER